MELFWAITNYWAVAHVSGFYHLLIYAGSIWQKSFVLVKYASMWNAPAESDMPTPLVISKISITQFVCQDFAESAFLFSKNQMTIFCAYVYKRSNSFDVLNPFPNHFHNSGGLTLNLKWLYVCKCKTMWTWRLVLDFTIQEYHHPPSRWSSTKDCKLSFLALWYIEQYLYLISLFVSSLLECEMLAF